MILWIPGRPAPQGSYRRGRAGQVYPASPFLAEWREAVAKVAHAHRPPEGPIRGPVAISLTFEIHRPLAHYRLGEPGAGIRPAYLAAYPRRPDLDKIARSTLDGLVMGDLLRDDAQVIRLAAAKAYSTAEGCSVSVDEVAP